MPDRRTKAEAEAGLAAPPRIRGHRQRPTSLEGDEDAFEEDGRGRSEVDSGGDDDVAEFEDDERRDRMEDEDDDDDDDDDDAGDEASSRGSASGGGDPDPDDDDGKNSDDNESMGAVRRDSRRPRDDIHNDDAQQKEGPSHSKKAKKPHKLSLTKTENFNETLKKRGVVYVARIPPRMTPTKVKTLLGDFGEVTRVYLVEEDAAVRRRRRKLQGGNGSKRYTEGWVEFANKSVAKHVAASLNGSAITNYKRSPHHGDLWSLKYLSKFKWSHLTEKVAYERRVREQKLRLETMQARRDTVAYKQLVETGHKLDKIQERKRRREERMKNEGGRGGAGGESEAKKKNDTYKARQVSPMDADTAPRPSKKPLLGSLL